MLIFKSKILLLHVSGSNVKVYIYLYCTHVNLYIVRMCASNIITKICRKVYVMGKYETGICINSMQAISYTSINGRLTVIGG